MPPEPLEFRGRIAVTDFFATVPAGGHLDRLPLRVTTANGQPALAAYETVHSAGRPPMDAASVADVLRG